MTGRTLGVLAEPEVTAEFAERNAREVGALLNLADERHDWSVVIKYQDFTDGNGFGTHVGIPGEAAEPTGMSWSA